jgi:anti-sigma B factor antagonist
MTTRSATSFRSASPGQPELTLRPAGDIDLGSVAYFREQWSSLIDSCQPQLLAIDLSEVTFLDCRGISLLVEICRRQRARGGDLVLTNPPPLPARALHLTEVDRIIRVTSAASSPDNRRSAT